MTALRRSTEDFSRQVGSRDNSGEEARDSFCDDILSHARTERTFTGDFFKSTIPAGVLTSGGEFSERMAR